MSSSEAIAASRTRMGIGLLAPVLELCEAGGGRRAESPDTNPACSTNKARRSDSNGRGIEKTS